MAIAMIISSANERKRLVKSTSDLRLLRKESSSRRKVDDDVQEGAIPAYLLDRETTTRAKVLSNTVKQKRKEKAGKWEVPLPKCSEVHQVVVSVPSCMGVFCWDWVLIAGVAAYRCTCKLELFCVYCWVNLVCSAAGLWAADKRREVWDRFGLLLCLLGWFVYLPSCDLARCFGLSIFIFLCCVGWFGVWFISG